MSMKSPSIKKCIHRTSSFHLTQFVNHWCRLCSMMDVHSLEICSFVYYNCVLSPLETNAFVLIIYKVTFDWLHFSTLVLKWQRKQKATNK